MENVVRTGVVKFFDSALGHTVRDAFVSFGSTLLLILVDWLSNVQLTGKWTEFAIFVPVLVTLIKGYMHVKEPGLPNLPTSLSSNANTAT